MKRSELLLGLLRLPVDALAVMASLLLAYRLREAQVDLIPGVQLLEPATTLPTLGVYTDSFVIPSIGAFLLLAAVLGLYALRSTRSAWHEMGSIVITALLWLVLVVAWFFFVQKQLFYSRILLFHAVFFLAVFSIVGRTTLVLLQRSLLRLGIGVRIVVSVGQHPITPLARHTLEHDARYRYVGHLQDLAGIRRLAHTPVIDLVLQTDPDPDSEQTVSLIDFCRSRHIGYGFFPPVFSDVPHQLRIERLGMLPMMRFQPTPLDGWGRIVKRGGDVAGGGVLLILLLPLLLLIALCIVIDSGWPVLFVSQRVGDFGKRRIPMLKFRSMVCDAEARKNELQHLSHRSDGPLFKVRCDPRVTRCGRILRRWSLDELPQLINVIAGQMSLVGPRPHLPAEVEHYTHVQRRVFAVRPGMTGLAQVMGRSTLPFGEEVKYDLQYVEEWSPLLDLWILWRTMFAVLKKDGAE
ncbi:MAG: exopolysaccharide biosynthesis polyprenyl glycosylphosphotransferase [Candidatus Peribacteraceae bacterium]|nr:exopolysaccharide biosynthesis polyprenyl glycosylphosphotransferase [Candidatus Peribacteraceae bacterium]MDD5741813.1 exopolysaccharide biosynthesis polyprenyl glycosylphosphotransferase [Candidatus Peribacteraceae bacterium]